MKRGVPSTGATDEIFGIPTVLTESEGDLVSCFLRELWELVYGSVPADFESDIQKVRAYFDPTIRGFKLRERLAELPQTPPDLTRKARDFGEPLIVMVTDESLLVGVEARILIMLLQERSAVDGLIALSKEEVVSAERLTSSIYRDWATQRLHQVIELRSGRGAEVMQAVSVGLVLALLVNRSTNEDRAIARLGDLEIQDQVDAALFSSADRFADIIAKNRGRSVSEKKLRRGYHLSEARRRLAHRLIVKRDRQNGIDRIYIPETVQAEVVSLIGRDLARRPRLSTAKLEAGFDALVVAFRSEARRLANRSMVFERASDTDSLRRRLIAEFQQARNEH